jgi:hypothetical protein
MSTSAVRDEVAEQAARDVARLLVGMVGLRRAVELAAEASAEWTADLSTAVPGRTSGVA